MLLQPRRALQLLHRRRGRRGPLPVGPRCCPLRVAGLLEDREPSCEHPARALDAGERSGTSTPFSTSTPSLAASAPRSPAAGEPIPSLTCRASRHGADLGRHPLPLGRRPGRGVPAVNSSAPSTVLRQIHGSAGPAQRIPPWPTASSLPGSHTLFYRVSAEGVIDVVRAWMKNARQPHHL